VRIYPAWLRTRGFIFLFSGERGWGAAEEEAARDFARAGRLVAGIDSPQLLNWENSAGGNCVYLPGQLESYSRAQQRSANTAQYLEPVLLGHDIGGTLVYVAQVQAPALAFHAAVAIDPLPQIELQRPLCDHPPAQRTAGGQILKPEPPSGNVPGRVLLDRAASAAAREFAAAIPGDAPLTLADSPLYAAYRNAIDGIDAERQRGGVGELPLVEVAAAGASDCYAILYSGDGGWRDLDRTLAEVLAAKGMSVVGVDVLRYFWQRRSPAAAAGDLARIMRFYQQRWQRRQVVLIGFSFGADVLPFLVNRLPADLRAEIRQVTLLSPERSTGFEVEPSGWLGMHSSDSTPIAPELQRLSGIAVQCIYGEDEAADSLCTSPAAAHLSVIAKSGGHHFDENYGELADQILQALPAVRP
jgi:type IV secretory pathway VirJ component